MRPFQSFYDYDKEFQEAPLDDFVDLPAGIYTAMIVDCGPGTTDDDGLDYFEFKMRILAGEFKGSTINKRQFINERGVEFLRRDLARLSFNAKNMPLPALLDPAFKPKLQGVCVEIKCVKNTVTKPGEAPKEYTNYYINRMVKATIPDEPPRGQESAAAPQGEQWNEKESDLSDDPNYDPFA